MLAANIRVTRFILPVLLAGAVLAGCGGGKEVYVNGHERISAPLGSISIWQLAGRLDMEVVDSSQTTATLRDSGNLVVIYADPGGRAYVNSKPVGQPGGIVPAGDMLFVPQSLEVEIRRWLRPAPKVTPKVEQPRAAAARLGRVVIDAGHGGRDPGAISIFGQYEKDVNLKVALAVARRLRALGADVTLTRRGDAFVELNERAEIANRLRAKLFVSIHADAAANPSARGFTVYVARAASKRSLRAAREVAGRLREEVAASRGIRRANYRVLVRTRCPAMLVELGYLSNYGEAARLADSGYCSRLAEAIADGVAAFLEGS